MGLMLSLPLGHGSGRRQIRQPADTAAKAKLTTNGNAVLNDAVTGAAPSTFEAIPSEIDASSFNKKTLDEKKKSKRRSHDEGTPPDCYVCYLGVTTPRCRWANPNLHRNCSC